ncbi:hypothetical protein Tcan_12229 [Toxocara canis]|uniref:Uncharacterized protein n=1 Tax=Toxocara canis TaxID=6265 RepID=A0A0B2VWF9_TOXCA|nr:hypothetical protein Tcan_12229 [Toxocara canis]
MAILAFQYCIYSCGCGDEAPTSAQTRAELSASQNRFRRPNISSNDHCEGVRSILATRHERFIWIIPMGINDNEMNIQITYRCLANSFCIARKKNKRNSQQRFQFR